MLFCLQFYSTGLICISFQIAEISVLQTHYFTSKTSPLSNIALNSSISLMIPILLRTLSSLVNSSLPLPLLIVSNYIWCLSPNISLYLPQIPSDTPSFNHISHPYPLFAPNFNSFPSIWSPSPV